MNTELQPIFLVGAERSGTTLLRLMLDFHPELAFQNEFEYITDEVGDSGQFPEMNGYRQWLAGHRIFQESGFTIDDQLDYRALAHSFLEQKRTRDGKAQVGATVHHNYQRLLYIWPEARLLKIVRDPRDVSRSTIGMGWAGNVWVGCDRWLAAERIWEDLKPKLDEDRYLEIRYESLIQNAEAELRTICKFLGVAFNEVMFSYADNSTYDLPDPKLVYQWKKKLSQEDVARVEYKVGDLLEKRGYEPSGYPPIIVDAAAEQALIDESRRYCRRFRLKRYGLPLLLTNKVAKALALKGLEAYCRARFNKIDRKYLK